MLAIALTKIKLLSPGCTTNHYQGLANRVYTFYSLAIKKPN